MKTEAAERIFGLISTDHLDSLVFCFIAAILGFLFLRFRKAMLKENGFHKSIRDELCVIHKRIDKSNSQIDRVEQVIDDIHKKIGWIEGYIKGQQKRED